MRWALVYGAVYLLWVVTTAVGILTVVVVRDTYQLALNRTSWHRYTLHAVDRFATVFLALALILTIVIVEHYYRTGVRKGWLLTRFCLFTTVEFAVLFLSQVLRVLLESSLGMTDTMGIYLSIGGFCGVVVFAWLARHLRQQSVRR